LTGSAEGWSERRETAKQIRRFIVIGVASVLTDFAVYTLLTRAGLLWDVSKGVSYVSGMVVGFIGNKLWTFQSARRSPAEPITYILLYTTTRRDHRAKLRGDEVDHVQGGRAPAA